MWSELPAGNKAGMELYLVLFPFLGTWEDLHICSSQMPRASCSKGQERQASTCPYWGRNLCLVSWMWRELYGSAGFLLADSIAGW